MTDYGKFMFNPENAHRCSECPENWGCVTKDFDGRYPCGQQNCWVIAHCRHARAYQDEDDE